MFPNKTLVRSKGKHNFYPISIEWISLNKFLIIKKKSIGFYYIKSRKNFQKIPKCFNRIHTISEISFFRIFLKTKFFVLLAFDGAFFFRNLTNTKISRLFFSEVCIMELAYDRTHSEIIYLLTNEQKYHQFFPNSRNFFHLCVFNMDQKKILKIMDFKKEKVGQILFRFLPKKNLIIIIQDEIIFFFFLNWVSRKIFLKKISHPYEICSFFLFGEFLLVSDRKGYLIIYNFKNDIKTGSSSLESKYKKNFTIFSRKIVKLSFGAFSFLTHLDKSTLLLNFKGRCEILKINSEKVYRKKISLLNDHEKIIDLKKNEENFKKFLVTTTKGVSLLTLKKTTLIQNILKFENFYDLGKNFCNFNFSTLKIEIFHCPSISDQTFLVFGLKNLIHFYHFEKSSVIRKYFNITGTKDSPENLNKKLNGICASMGKFLFFSDGRLFFKIITNQVDFDPVDPQDQNWVLESTYKNVSQNSNGNNLIFQKNGKKVGIKLSDHCFKFHEYLFTRGFLSHKNKFLMFFRKKCLTASFSENGSLFVCAFSGFLTVWKIFPDIKKKKTIGVEIKGEIEKVTFLSGKNKNLILASSHHQLLIWNFSENRIQFKMKLKIFNMEPNQIDEKFLVCTEYYRLARKTNTRIFAVFKSNNDIPLAIFSSIIFPHRIILCLNFYYGVTKKKKNRLIFLDNFLDLHQFLF